MLGELVKNKDAVKADMRFAKEKVEELVNAVSDLERSIISDLETVHGTKNGLCIPDSFNISSGKKKKYSSFSIAILNIKRAVGEDQMIVKQGLYLSGYDALKLLKYMNSRWGFSDNVQLQGEELKYEIEDFDSDNFF